YIEFATFAFGLVPLLLRRGFDAFYVIEGPLYKFLHRWRNRFSLRYRLVHFTGGQLGDIPATDLDYLHHVTPAYQLRASELGFSSQNQFLIPDFVDVDRFSHLASNNSAIAVNLRS